MIQICVLKYTLAGLEIPGNNVLVKNICAYLASANVHLNGTILAIAPELMKYNTSLVMRKPAFCICENKDADQLRGNREADQRLCFGYTDSTIPLLLIYEISSL